MLLEHYGIVDDARIDELLALGKAARERSWWSVYSDVAPQRLLQFVEYEAAAMITRSFEPLLIPGLLQTEEYTREVIGKFDAHYPKDRMDALIAFRLKRQELLKQGGPPPWSFFILDESVVRRQVGGRNVMRGQIRHLIEMASRDNVTIEIVPFAPASAVGCKGRSWSLSFLRQRMMMFCTWRALGVIGSTGTIQRRLSTIGRPSRSYEACRSAKKAPSGSCADCWTSR